MTSSNKYNSRGCELPPPIPPPPAQQISKKQLLVKEIAVNILELNGYKTRTEQLDTELKNYTKLKNEINMNQSSRDFLSLSEKTEVN